MMSLNSLRRIVRLHMTWLVVKLLGEDVVSKEELDELKKYDKLPMGDSIDFVKKSYILGRLFSVSKSSKYKKINSKELDKIVKNSSLTKIEELAIKEAKLHAATNIKRLADDIAAGAFDHLEKELATTITESIIKDIIKDEVALALQEKKSYQKLASSLAKKLKVDWSDRWSRIAETELHRAKMRGAAMALVNKLDIYKSSDGVDSLVSIVPSATTCPDCKQHYLTSSGNPKVFKLRDLLSTGSNGDPGTKHTRDKNGLHDGWRTVLPPMHPRCTCKLVYIPPGMGWVDGKLVVTKKDIYAEEIKKAVDTGSLSATVKPPGPKAAQAASPAVKAAASPPSIKGAPSPSNAAATINAKAGGGSGGGGTGGGGSNVDWEYWRGDGQPPAGGGWEQSPSGKWRRPVGSGGGAEAAAEKPEDKQQKIEEAKNWSKQPKSTEVVMNHLSSGGIADIYQMGTDDKEEAGINESFRVTIDGNGRGLMKPSQKLGDKVLKEGAYTEGCGTVPHGTHHKNEEGAYKFFTALGMDHCPPTTQRIHNGEETSVQAWQEDKVQAMAHFGEMFGEKGYNFTDLLDASSDPEGFKNTITEITVTDLIMNSQDRHMGNLMISEDLSDVKAIDHGTSFGAGMMGFKSVPMQMMARGGHKVKIPDHMQERLSNTSLGDMERALGDTHQDWQISQTFLRTQYVMHLQETEGHLDYKKFQPYMYNVNSDLGVPDKRMWNGNAFAEASYKALYEPRTRPNELFEDFAIEWMDKHASDPSSPHHESAKKIKDQGVFMGPGHATDPAAYRASGKHKEYEAKARKDKVTAERERASMATTMKEQKMPSYVRAAMGGGSEAATKKPSREAATKKPSREAATKKPNRSGSEAATIKPSRPGSEAATTKPGQTAKVSETRRNLENAPTQKTPAQQIEQDKLEYAATLSANDQKTAAPGKKGAVNEQKTMASGKRAVANDQRTMPSKKVVKKSLFLENLDAPFLPFDK